MKMFLVRHCQSTGGLPESGLTERGHRAAAQLTDQLAPLCPDAIYASQYARAVATVSPLATRLQTEIKVDDRFRERVRSCEEITDVERYLRLSFADEDYRATGGESLKEAAARGLAALADIRREEYRCVVVASHRTLITSILRSIDPQFGLDEWRAMMAPEIFSLRFNGLRPIAFDRFE